MISFHVVYLLSEMGVAPVFRRISGLETDHYLFNISSLYNLCDTNVFVAKVMLNKYLNIKFRRPLTWRVHMIERLMIVSLCDDADYAKYKLNPSGIFSVKSMHANYVNGCTPFFRKY